MVGLGGLRLVIGDIAGGVWTIFVGWFLSQAAGATRRERRLHESLRGVPVEQVMDPAPSVVEAGGNLQQMVFERVLRSGRHRLVVVRAGHPVGLIDAATIKTVPRDRWPVTSVEQVMMPIPFFVSPETDIADLLEWLDEPTIPVPVVADDRLVGVVDLLHVLRYAQLREELQLPVSTTRPTTV
jgi:predicted transcriptional regulator